ncbi:Ribose-5-phosphate isomerase [Dirofilaria immitis]
MIINTSNIISSSLSLSPFRSFRSSSFLAFSLSSSSSSSPSSSSRSSSSSSTTSSSSSSSPLPLIQSTNDEEIMSACGKRHIILDSKHPEYVINFPVTSNFDNTDYQSLKENYLLSDEMIRKQRFPYPLDFYVNNNTPISRCQWLITTDPYHSIGAEIKVSNESGYFLNITNENGLRKNCTSKICLIRSDASAILVQFRTKQINHYQSDSGFSAKFVILPLSSDRSGAVIVAIWILLISFAAILIIFVIIIYLYCMKKKLLFSQLLTILRSKNRKNGSESKERKITLPNGTLITLAYRPGGQHGNGITSTQLNTVQRMPTILEETENDNESRASNRELSGTYAVTQHIS